MSFPPSFLEELRTRLPLSAYAGKKLRLVRAGREYKACCPFHNEKTPSFYINDAKGFYHCFGCGAHGDVINFAMQANNLSFPDAIRQLAGEAGLPVPEQDAGDRDAEDRQKSLYALIDWTANWFARALETTEGQQARDYLKNRGLSAETIARFRLGFAPADASKLRLALEQAGFKPADAVEVGILKAPEDGREPYSFFRNRVIFPVADSKGRVVAFGARLLTGDGPKYLNSSDHPLFHKGQMLYNLNNAKEAPGKGQPFIVVEGYMDVISLAEAGFTGAVAPLGTALTEQQMALLWRLQHNRPELVETSPVLCFDGDGAGYRAAERSLMRLLPQVTPTQTFRIAHMPEGDDPDSLIRKTGADAFRQVLAASAPLFTTLWSQKTLKRDLASPEARARLKAELEQLFTEIADSTVRALYRDELKERLYSLQQQQRQPRRSAGMGSRDPHRRMGNYNVKNQGLSRDFSTPLLPLRAPKNSRQLIERILLALLINHPALYPDVAEDFARYPFTNPALETLRLSLIDYFDRHNPAQSLDAEASARYLSVAGQDRPGLQEALDIVLSEATYLHARFVQPDRPLVQARQGWRSIWGQFVQDQVKGEKRAHGRVLRDSIEEGEGEKVLDRLLALHHEIEAQPDPFAEDDETGHYNEGKG